MQSGVWLKSEEDKGNLKSHTIKIFFVENT